MIQANMTSAAALQDAPGHPPWPVRASEGGPALPAIPPAQLPALNAFYRPRPVAAFSLAGRPATVTASWPPPRDLCDRCRLEIAVDGAAGAVTLSRPLVEAAIAALDPDQRLDHLDPQQLALLLELALGDGLSMLEAVLGASLAVTAVRLTGGDKQTQLVPLAFGLTVEGFGTSSGELLLQPGHAVMLAQLLDRETLTHGPLGSGGEADGEAAIDLPVAICVRVAASTCSAGEIATLAPGDVVVADHSRPHTQTAVVVIAEHLVAPAELISGAARITARPTRAHGSLWEWSMENGKEGLQADVLQKTRIDDIPVRLVFELGRVEMSLAEIRQLAPGALVPMSRPMEEGVDIVANGRRIGRGSLVQIGDSLGVRIVRLFDHG